MKVLRKFAISSIAFVIAVCLCVGLPLVTANADSVASSAVVYSDSYATKHYIHKVSGPMENDKKVLYKYKSKDYQVNIGNCSVTIHLETTNCLWPNHDDVEVLIKQTAGSHDMRVRGKILFYWGDYTTDHGKEHTFEQDLTKSDPVDLYRNCDDGDDIPQSSVTNNCRWNANYAYVWIDIWSDGEVLSYYDFVNFVDGNDGKCDYCSNPTYNDFTEWIVPWYTNNTPTEYI